MPKRRSRDREVPSDVVVVDSPAEAGDTFDVGGAAMDLMGDDEPRTMSAEDMRANFDKTQSKPKKEKAKSEPEPEEELEEDEDVEAAELDDTEDEEHEVEQGEEDEELEDALDVLRRDARLSRSLLKGLSREQALELADQWQAQSDEAHGGRLDRIRAEEAGDRNGAARTNGRDPGANAVPSEAIQNAARQAIRALGGEEDEGTLRALVEFGTAARGNLDAELSDARRAAQEATGLVETLLLRDAKAALAEVYPRHVSNPKKVDALRVRMEELAGPRYANDLDALYRDAAALEWGRPTRGGRRKAVARKSKGGPATRTSKKRAPKKVVRGSEQHMRAVYDQIRRRSKAKMTSGG